MFRELEVEHPAAKLMILGSQMQETEVGDATNFVIIFAGALLKEAEDLLRYRYRTLRVSWLLTFWISIISGAWRNWYGSVLREI